MLENVKKAYDRNAITAENQCPISLETIETYLQILAPAYRISVGFQKTSSTIADIIPSVEVLLRIWNNLELTDGPKRLCKVLRLTLMNKFEDELGSEVHRVSYAHFSINKILILKLNKAALILKTSKLKIWINSSFGNAYLISKILFFLSSSIEKVFL